MRQSSAIVLRLASPLVVAAVAYLSLAGVVHTHPLSAPNGTCVACAASHVHAPVPDVATGVIEPERHAESLPVDPEKAVCRIVVRPRSSRAPPPSSTPIS